jgi:hypothetical protein
MSQVVVQVEVLMVSLKLMEVLVVGVLEELLLLRQFTLAVLVYKILEGVEEDLLLMQEVVKDLVVLVVLASSSSHILHKYTQNFKVLNIKNNS